MATYPWYPVHTTPFETESLLLVQYSPNFKAYCKMHHPQHLRNTTSLGKMILTKQSRNPDNISTTPQMSSSQPQQQPKNYRTLRNFMSLVGDYIMKGPSALIQNLVNINNALSVTVVPNEGIITPDFFKDLNRGGSEDHPGYYKKNSSWNNEFQNNIETPFLSEKHSYIINEMKDKSMINSEKLEKSDLNEEDINQSKCFVQDKNISNLIMNSDATVIPAENTEHSKTIEKQDKEAYKGLSLHSRSMSESSCDSEDSFCIVFRNDLGSISDPESDSDFELDDIIDESDTDSEDDVIVEYEYDEDIEENSCKEREEVPEHVATKVRFNLEDTVHVIYMDCAFDASEARAGPWEVMARDREHFRRRVNAVSQKIEHVFTNEHRLRIWRERFENC